MCLSFGLIQILFIGFHLAATSLPHCICILYLKIAPEIACTILTKIVQSLLPNQQSFLKHGILAFERQILKIDCFTMPDNLVLKVFWEGYCKVLCYKSSMPCMTSHYKSVQILNLNSKILELENFQTWQLKFQSRSYILFNVALKIHRFSSTVKMHNCLSFMLFILFLNILQ